MFPSPFGMKAKKTKKQTRKKTRFKYQKKTASAAVDLHASPSP